MGQGVSVRSGDMMVLVGTKKGAFILTGGESRRRWLLSDLFSQGSDVFHLVYDRRGEGKLFAATNSMWFGPQVEFSQDLGAGTGPTPFQRQAGIRRA